MPPSSSPSAGLSAFLSKKFLKFCVVGFSGVFVNLGALTLFTSLGLLSSFASALAIYISILSNFVMNEWWTFRDQRGSTGILTRALRFQVVSLVGAAIQWSVFLVVNVGCLWWLQGSESVDIYLASSANGIVGVTRHLIMSPPEIGHGVYISQLVGIAVATVWNYLANFFWTWRTEKNVD